MPNIFKMFKPHPLPTGLHFFSPIVLLASFGGSGFLRPASGSWGSLAALPFGIFILLYFNNLILIILSITLFIIGLWATHYWLQKDTNSDPSAVVIDEAAGQWLTLAFITPEQLSWVSILAAFLLFRLFDIIKPWPASYVDKHMLGAWGVMLDDMLAAMMAGVLLYFGWSYVLI